MDFFNKIADEIVLYDDLEVYDAIEVSNNWVDVICANKKIANRVADELMVKLNDVICVDFRKTNGGYKFSVIPRMNESKKNLKEMEEYFDVKKFKSILSKEGFKVTNKPKDGKIFFECGRFGARNYMCGSVTYYRDDDKYNYLHIDFPINYKQELSLDKFEDTDDIIRYILQKWEDVILSLIK